MTKFNRGDLVKDRDGYKGTITKVTEWEGSTWYDVRFVGGEAVRFERDIMLEQRYVARLEALLGPNVSCTIFDDKDSRH